MFHYTAETTASIQDAIAALETSLKEEQFGVLWRFNLREKLKEKGFDFERDYVVLEVCNPAEASRVVSGNVLAGYFLPCKIVVYEADGKTKIGMPKPTAFMNMLEDDALKSIAADVEVRLIGCIDRVANPRQENR
jgi:uncharacterized protein (DUF302 family)